MKSKLWAYENFSGDYGVIIAPTYEKAMELYKADYPTWKVIPASRIRDENESYLFEVGDIKDEELYAAFPW